MGTCVLKPHFFLAGVWGGGQEECLCGGGGGGGLSLYCVCELRASNIPKPSNLLGSTDNSP